MSQPEFNPQELPVTEVGTVEQATEKETTPNTHIVGKELTRDFVLVFCWVAATDYLLYRIGTYCTWAIFFFFAIPFLFLAKPKKSLHWRVLTIGCVLLLVGVKLLWAGSAYLILIGTLLLCGWAVSLTGIAPVLPESLGFLFYCLAGAGQRMSNYRFQADAGGAAHGTKLGASIFIPLIVLALFSTLFILANPDLTQQVQSYLATLSQWISNFFLRFQPFEIAFWIITGFIALGLLYPVAPLILPEQQPQEIKFAKAPAKYYIAFRNSLFSVIVLFALYLVFEFSTLWFREFPEGFYYAGYAHQGAFWLTLALALATLFLSLVFRGDQLADPRISKLKTLTWIWSIENLLLSASVFNRMFIYIDFNGMTRMRVIGLLGTLAVLGGFGVVLLKIVRQQGFIWLLHRQLWTLAAVILLGVVLPIDWIVNRFNTTQILNGRLAPSAQIVAHQTSASGMLPICDLVDCDDPTIREGVRGLLALWAEDMELDDGGGGLHSEGFPVSTGNGWTSEYGHSCPWHRLHYGFSKVGRRSSVEWQNTQLAERLLAERLRAINEKLSEYRQSESARNQAIDAYFRYAYQWY